MTDFSICDWCHKTTPTTGAILDGKYGQACRGCRDDHQRISSTLAAQHYRDSDRDDHQRDALQPWVNGKPNTEYIRQYPEYAADNFTEDELKQYG